MAAFHGMNAANSYYFCLWCLCNKSEIQNLDKPLGYLGIDRDFESCCSNSKSKAEERKGSKFNPLLKVDFKRVIPDTLRLFLRLSELLIDNLAMLVIDNGRTREMEEAAVSAHVRFSLYETKCGGSSVMKWTELDTLQSEKLLANITMDTVMGDHRDKAQV